MNVVADSFDEVREEGSGGGFFFGVSFVVVDLEGAVGVPFGEGDAGEVAMEAAFLGEGVGRDRPLSGGHADDVEEAGVVLFFEEDKDFFTDEEGGGAGDVGAVGIGGATDLADHDFGRGRAFEGFEGSEGDVGVDPSVFGVPRRDFANDFGVKDLVGFGGHLFIVELDDDRGEGRREEGEEAHKERKKRELTHVGSFGGGRRQRRGRKPRGSKGYGIDRGRNKRIRSVEVGRRFRCSRRG